MDENRRVGAREPYSIDFSKPETKALYEIEVGKRMKAPFLMERQQAEMLVAVLMTALFEELGEPDNKLVRWSHDAPPFEMWSRESIEAAFSRLNSTKGS